MNAEFDNKTELEQLRAEVVRLATIDGHTGLLNKTEVMARGDQEVHRALRFQRPMTLLLIDLDQFYEVSERLGQAAGEHLVKRLGEVLFGNFRQVDVVGRLGGDSFIALLPETPLHNALRLSERVRAQVADQNLDEQKRVGEDAPLMTVSIGVVERLSQERRIDPILERAKAALARARRGGGDRVSTA